MYEYRAKIVRVIDGDTVDVDIDLGFGVWMKDERVRIMGIDTPESRTRDKVEKKFGKLAKQFLVDWIEQYDHILVESSAKGKFGRILGNLYDPEKKECWNEMAIEAHHAVPYEGQSKDDIKKGHLENRKWLIENGLGPE